MPFSVPKLPFVPSTWPVHVLIALVGVAVILAPFLGARARAGAPVTVRGERFVDTTGQEVFLLGVNYEGPADRAWQMWDDERFDATLIRQDFERAHAAGITVLRVFVQLPLANDIRNGRWTKLDAVLDLADRLELKVILTFADYPEGRLANLTAVDSAVASRYRGRPTILAYDLKNEPRFGDLALAQYPPGVYVSLQDPATVALVGEAIPREEMPAYRASDEGEARIPAALSDDQAYIYANLLAAYLDFLAEAADWTRTNDSTSVAYVLSPDSAPWNDLEDALNDTLATWMKVRLDALRAADPEALVTVGHTDTILASLPANNLLDYRTIHRYPGASSASIQAAVQLFRDLRGAIPGKPLVLGEFGFSNADVPEDRSAALEAELVRGVRESGGAGALKWMLNDFPHGFNARENGLGMFRGDGSAKPVVGSFRELTALAPLGQPTVSRPVDYDIAQGHFFTQTSGRPRDRDPSGYSVTDADGVLFWSTWKAWGLDSLGYPLSGRFNWRGFPTQVFQKAVLQWRPDVGIVPINLFDELHDQGFDDALRARELVPTPLDTATEDGETWEQLARSRLALLEANEAIQDRYSSAPDPFLLYGLPTSSVENVGDAFAIRTQRAALFEWKVDVPWAAVGEVTVANAGEIAKALGLFPVSALVPEPPGVAAS